MQQRKLTRAIREILKNKGIRYATVAQWLGLSESSVKRIFAKERLTLEQIEMVAETLGVGFVDLVHLANPQDRLPELLSEEQERQLVEKPELLRVFYLLFRHWTVLAIAETWRLSDADVVKLLVALDKIGLIKLLPRNRVKLLVSASLRWRPSGPIVRFFRSDVTTGFVSGCQEKQKGHLITFIPCELGDAAAQRLMTRLKEIISEIQEVSDFEAATHKETVRGHGVLLAMRPWVHPLFVSPPSNTD
jgi:transcriptional regulator with XRE-family HTH domain